ncbi:MAG: 50S ribosomal protein L32 [Kiritimatiellae bacterium]|nr:50S ribosomal protein L32 [Kiritimatiellia bacterium]
MAVPKRKKSKMKIRMRKAQKKAEIPATTTCPACGAPVQTHRACPSCGMYRGRKVVSVDAPKE